MTHDEAAIVRAIDTVVSEFLEAVVEVRGMPPSMQTHIEHVQASVTLLNGDRLTMRLAFADTDDGEDS
jgi:hypothetical protein